MRVLICPNAFKGCLTSIEAAAAIHQGIRDSGHEGIVLPLADGGDGTLETLVNATGGEIVTSEVTGSLGGRVAARWGKLGGGKSGTAVIEMAEAAGLRLLRPEEYNPLVTTTYGVGELIKLAVEAGCREILVGIGGSATNDGGAGMAQALGARLLDDMGEPLSYGGYELRRLHSIDRTQWSLLPDVTVTVACDVNSPLLGRDGASRVFGPQKGATPEMVEMLESSLSHYADFLDRLSNRKVSECPGAGAAGGLGAGLMAFCNATLKNGIDFVLDSLNFGELCNRSDIVLTGEGKIDDQTIRGKVISGVLRRSTVPVIAITGSLTVEGELSMYENGLTAAFSLCDMPMELEEALVNARVLLRRAAERVGRMLSLTA